MLIQRLDRKIGVYQAYIISMVAAERGILEADKRENKGRQVQSGEQRSGN